MAQSGLYHDDAVCAQLSRDVRARNACVFLLEGSVYQYLLQHTYFICHSHDFVRIALGCDEKSARKEGGGENARGEIPFRIARSCTYRDARALWRGVRDRNISTGKWSVDDKFSLVGVAALDRVLVYRCARACAGCSWDLQFRTKT